MAKGKSESKRLLSTIKANEADEEKVKDTRREREREGQESVGTFLEQS